MCWKAQCQLGSDLYAVGYWIRPGVSAQRRMQGHDTDRLTVAIVGLLTIQNLPSRLFLRPSGLLHICKHSTVTVFAHDSSVNAASIVYTALADILG